MLYNRHRNPIASFCVACSATIVLVTGCGAPASTVATNDGSAASATVDTNAQSTAGTNVSLDQLLVGQWLGQAIIDDDALEAKLVNMTEAQQEAVVLSSENFLSTLMAIDFRGDGTVESEVQITPLGQQPIQDSSLGQWRVTQIADDQVMVETSELAEDGTTSTSQKTFRFYPDGNAFEMAVPVGPELQGCDAVIIFERQSAAANMAQRPAETQQK